MLLAHSSAQQLALTLSIIAQVFYREDYMKGRQQENQGKELLNIKMYVFSVVLEEMVNYQRRNLKWFSKTKVVFVCFCLFF